jgi:amino acid adenylation domain-containing protein
MTLSLQTFESCCELKEECGNVCERFYQWVRRSPGAVVWREDGCTKTYAELDERVQEWQVALRELCVTKGERVLIALSATWDCVSCLLACLAEGVVYVVLPTGCPEEYREGMIGDLQPVAVACDEAEREAFAAFQCLQSARGGRITPRLFVEFDVAYIAYTSGTTGKPKGVIHTHANILHEVRVHQQTLEISEKDRFSGLYHLSTVGSVRDLFAALLSGAAYCPFVVQQHSWTELTQYVTDNGITRLHMVPPLFRSWVRSVIDGERFPEVQTVFLAGDKVCAEDVECVWKHLPNARFYTGLGASETSSLYVHRLVEREQYRYSQVLSSGKPIEGVSVELLDEYVSPESGQVVGEIAVSGRYLSLGYWGDSEQTRQRFAFCEDGRARYRTGDLGCWDVHGELCHLGRIDRQIKLNGIRIEPSGIEAVLKSIPGVQHAVVGVREIRGKSLLIAWLEGDAPIDGDRLFREVIQRQLPIHHQPGALVWLKSFPLNRTGKIDYGKLPDPEVASLPVTDEDELGQLFRSLLPLVVGELDSHKDFRELGGDSMGLVQLATEIQTRWGLSCSPDFWRQTVSINSIRQRLLQIRPAFHHGPWPVELYSLTSQWPRPESAACTDFPGYRIAGDPSAPLLIWLAQTAHEYQLPSRTEWPGERWVWGSPYPVLPTDIHSLSKWLTAVIDVVADSILERPVIVGGYCGSGSVAVLFATLLQQRGVTVQAALLWEAFGSSSAARRFFYGYATWLRSVQQMRETPLREWISFWRQKWRRFVVNRLGRERKDSQNSTAAARKAKRYPFGLHRVPYLNCPIHLVVSRNTRWFRFLYPWMGWSSQQRRTIQIHVVPGNHFSMMKCNTPERLFHPLKGVKHRI